MAFWGLQILEDSKVEKAILFLVDSLYHTYYVLLNLLRSIVNSPVHP